MRMGEQVHLRARAFADHLDPGKLGMLLELAIDDLAAR